MKTLGNILWFLFGGFILWLEWAFAGLVLCISIFGIPAGIQCFKIAGLCAFPFKKEISYESLLKIPSERGTGKLGSSRK